MKGNILTINNLFVKYDKSYILSSLSLELVKGKYYCLIGNNGSGKSTLVKAIVGLISTNKGNILFDNKDITNLEVHERINLGISYVSQTHSVYPKLKVKDHFELSSRSKTYSLEKLEMYFPEIIKLENCVAGTLSGGEQRLLALSLVLLQPKKKLIILDEILAGVDKKLIQKMIKVVRLLNINEEMTIFMIEQNEEFIKKFKGILIDIEKINKNEK